MGYKAELTDHSMTTRGAFPLRQQSAEEFCRLRAIPGLLHDPSAKYTYFMRDRRNGLIKIGMARHPDERRARLNSSGAHDVEILAVVRGGELERAYHKHFADLCAGGEWFHPHPDILAEIERLSNHPDDNREPCCHR